MLNEPEWLTFDEVIELNALAVEDTGEPHGFIDRGAAESALASCRNRHLYEDEVDIIDLACILMMAFARSQGFSQGNKRTGFLAAQMFLDINGYVLDMPDRTWIADMIIAAIDDRDFEPAVRAGVRAHVRPL